MTSNTHIHTPLYKVIRSIFANQLGFLVSAVVAFLLSPYVVHTLGDERYGIWTLIVSFSGHYGLLAFGIHGAMTRYIAHAVTSGDKNKASGYLSTAFSLLLPAALLSLVAGGVVALFFPNIFVIDPNSVAEAQIACLLVAVTAAATFAFASFHCVLVAHQRFDVSNAIGISSTLARAVMTVWLLSQGHGIVSLAALGLGLTIFTGIAQLFAVKVVCPLLKLSLRLIRRSYFKELISYGSKSFMISIAVALVYQCDLFVIGMYLPPENITIYSLAAMLVTYVIQFVSSIANVLGPYATERYARGGVAELRDFFIQGSCVMYMLGGLIVAGCLVFGEAFFTLWVGTNYTDSAVILTILIIPQFFATGARVGSSVLVGMAKVGPLAIVAICEGVSNLILSLTLVRYMGTIGVAMGTFVPLVLSNGLWFPLYIAQQLGVKVSIIYLKSMLPGLLVFVIGLILGQAIRQGVPPISWHTFVFDTFLITLSCSIFSYIVLSRIRGKSFWMSVFLRTIGVK